MIGCHNGQPEKATCQGPLDGSREAVQSNTNPRRAYSNDPQSKPRRAKVNYPPSKPSVVRLANKNYLELVYPLPGYPIADQQRKRPKTDRQKSTIHNKNPVGQNQRSTVNPRLTNWCKGAPLRARPWKMTQPGSSSPGWGQD